MSANRTKNLKVFTPSVIRGVDLYREAAGEWEKATVENGALIILRPDGTKRVYATGSWVGYETEYAS